MRLHEVPEYTLFRVGDTVTVKPRVGRKFTGRVRRILADDTDAVVEVEVVQESATKRMIRTARPETVTR
jgi:transcription antitermination factor NusG